MSWAEHASTLLEYDRWANTLVLAAAERAGEASLDRPRGVGRDTVRTTLAHILEAQSVWLARWTAAPRASFAAGSLPVLRESFARSHAALMAFVSAIGDADWERAVDYTDTAGKRHAVPLGQLITHVVNHGTHHRAEAGLMLADDGQSPGDMDYVFFRLGASEASAG
jgi:uncharacterized damage-inducible protein DinB